MTTKKLLPQVLPLDSESAGNAPLMAEARGFARRMADGTMPYRRFMATSHGTHFFTKVAGRLRVLSRGGAWIRIAFSSLNGGSAPLWQRVEDSYKGAPAQYMRGVPQDTTVGTGAAPPWYYAEAYGRVDGVERAIAFGATTATVNGIQPAVEAIQWDTGVKLMANDQPATEVIATPLHSFGTPGMFFLEQSGVWNNYGFNANPFLPFSFASEGTHYLLLYSGAKVPIGTVKTAGHGVYGNGVYGTRGFIKLTTSGPLVVGGAPTSDGGLIVQTADYVLDIQGPDTTTNVSFSGTPRLTYVPPDGGATLTLQMEDATVSGDYYSADGPSVLVIPSVKPGVLAAVHVYGSAYSAGFLGYYSWGANNEFARGDYDYAYVVGGSSITQSPYYKTYDLTITKDAQGNDTLSLELVDSGTGESALATSSKKFASLYIGGGRFVWGWDYGVPNVMVQLSNDGGKLSQVSVANRSSPRLIKRDWDVTGAGKGLTNLGDFPATATDLGAPPMYGCTGPDCVFIF